jgi:hypothetical protein
LNYENRSPLTHGNPKRVSNNTSAPEETHDCFVVDDNPSFL